MSSNLKIVKAGIDDIPLIRTLADKAFRTTYIDLLTPGQMEYMMDWMYSVDSLVTQVSAPGKEFFIAYCGNEPCGYASVEFEKTEDTGRPLYHLQKLYLLKDYQGHGHGRELITFMIDHLKELSPEGFKMELNVNRENKAVGFYEAMGLVRDRQGDFHIGNGYYMNDYIYTFTWR